MESIAPEPTMTTENPLEILPPLDSTEAIKWIWTCWRILAMHPFERLRRLYWIYFLLLNVVCCLLFPLHMAANLFYKTNFVGSVANLPITISVFCSITKQIVIFNHIRRNLWPIHEHLKVLDKRAAEHSEEHQIVAREVRFCRRMFIGVAIAYYYAAIAYAISGLIRHQLTFDGWIPFDFTASTSLYGIVFVIQLMCIIMLVVAELSNDTYGVSYLALLVAHVRALNVRVARIGTNPSRSVEQNHDDLVDCVSDHRVCTRFFELLSPVVSGTMSAQFLIAGVVLCITFVSLLGSDATLAEQLSYMFYVVCLMIETIPGCWFVDELTLESNRLTTALHQCRWYEQDKRFRRTLIIFMQRSQEPYAILAGNLVPVTLSTIRRIIQFAFSMFTVINQME